MIGFAILMMLQATGNPTVANNRVPDEGAISRLESKLIVPKGAGALTAYDRSYTEADFNGKDTIFGQMIDRRMMEEIAKSQGKPLPPPVRRSLMKDMTPIFDGGCGIVMVFYQVGADAAPKAMCNPDGPH